MFRYFSEGRTKKRRSSVGSEPSQESRDRHSYQLESVALTLGFHSSLDIQNKPSRQSMSSFCSVSVKASVWGLIFYVDNEILQRSLLHRWQPVLSLQRKKHEFQILSSRLLKQNIVLVQRLKNDPWSHSKPFKLYQNCVPPWATSAARSTNNAARSPCQYVNPTTLRKLVSSRISAARSSAHGCAPRTRASAHRTLTSSTSNDKAARCYLDLKAEQRRTSKEHLRDSKSSSRRVVDSILFLLNADEWERLPGHRLSLYSVGRLCGTKLAKSSMLEFLSPGLRGLHGGKGLCTGCASFLSALCTGRLCQVSLLRLQTLTQRSGPSNPHFGACGIFLARRGYESQARIKPTRPDADTLSQPVAVSNYERWRSSSSCTPRRTTSLRE